MHWKAAYEGPNDPLIFGGFSDPSVNDYVTIVGQNGVHHNLKVESISFEAAALSLDSPQVIHHMADLILMDNWGTSSGDSGGAVHASGNNPHYHEVIHGHVDGGGSSGKTIAGAWSNIDSHFRLN